MIYRYLVRWGILLIFGSSLLIGCTQASPTPIVQLPAATSVSAPSLPTEAQPVAPEETATEEQAAIPASPTSDGTTQATIPEGTVTLAVTPTKANPLDLPFLMKIDRVSVVVGRGTLLEGRVAHGTLQPNSGVEILGPQNQVLGASVLGTFVSSVVRDQVTVGDYAGILVGNVDATQVKPGMLLSEAGAYPSYEEALLELQ